MMEQDVFVVGGDGGGDEEDELIEIVVRHVSPVSVWLSKPTEARRMTP
jgi:hypothetical protein